MALPFFGGGAAVWTACMLFFQLFLLLGYLYSHCLTKLLSIKRQVSLHSLLIVSSLLFLPIAQFSQVSIWSDNTPQLNIIISLVMEIGFPYFLLSATAPLIQKWFSYAYENTQPYRLYALSNLGSLLALLSYPFLIEPMITTALQSTIWSWGYAVFALFILITASQVYSRKLDFSRQLKNNTMTEEKEKTIIPGLLWLGLSATSVVMMMATTNAMTQNIPPTPFLWILPLCIYLLTYIICFNNQKWYKRKYAFILFACSSLGAVLMFFIGPQFNIVTQVIIYASILFFACMICHGELAKLQPDKQKLTLYYLIIAIGGVLGSLFTAIVAEKIFTQYYEFPLSIFLIYLLFTLVLWQESYRKTIIKSQSQQNLYLGFASIAGLLFFSLYFLKLNNLYYKDNVHNSRNFYGTLSIKDFKEMEPPTRMLFDGSTSHGSQLLNTTRKTQATSYYRSDSGVALALETLMPGHNLKVGIVGLGTGTLASYGKTGDHYTFYELNPDVALAAKDYFSYLTDSKAKIEINIGDARINLQKELTNSGSQQYQVLILDAFSSDAIPMHLLTLEAFELYWQHLADEGLLVLHISNDYLDLLPLVATLSDETDKSLLHFITASEDENIPTAQWVVMTNNKNFINNNGVKNSATHLEKNMKNKVLWTDNYSNLLSVLKL